VWNGRAVAGRWRVREAVLRLRQEGVPFEEVSDRFNQELDDTIPSLDRGERVDPSDVRAELQRMSAERRRKTA